MPKGKRRFLPPPEYMSSGEAIEKLGKTLYKLVEAGRIRKITPEGHKQGFYHRGDVESALLAEQVFSQPYRPGQYKHNPVSRFERAIEDDMSAIRAIDAIFAHADDTTPIGVASVELSNTWLQKNRDSFYIVRNHQSVIVGYAELLPMKKSVIDGFIRDEIDLEDISADDIETYEPGQGPYHIYVMALVVDPQYSFKVRRAYGRRLVQGLYRAFLGLADTGIEIATITARSSLRDGQRLMRELGIPQLRSPVPGKSLFRVNVAESGFPWFVQYTERLATWKAEHAPQHPAIDVAPSTSSIDTPKPKPRIIREPQPRQDTSSSIPEELPEGTRSLRDFAAELGVDRTTLLEQVKTQQRKGNPAFEHIEIAKPGQVTKDGSPVMDRYFSPQQQENVRAWRAEHPYGR